MPKKNNFLWLWQIEINKRVKNYWEVLFPKPKKPQKQAVIEGTVNLGRQQAQKQTEFQWSKIFSINQNYLVFSKVTFFFNYILKKMIKNFDHSLTNLLTRETIQRVFQIFYRENWKTFVEFTVKRLNGNHAMLLLCLRSRFEREIQRDAENPPIPEANSKRVGFAVGRSQGVNTPLGQTGCGINPVCWIAAHPWHRETRCHGNGSCDIIYTVQ
jgi:hypothetical protein